MAIYDLHSGIWNEIWQVNTISANQISILSIRGKHCNNIKFELERERDIMVEECDTPHAIKIEIQERTLKVSSYEEHLANHIASASLPDHHHAWNFNKTVAYHLLCKLEILETS